MAYNRPTKDTGAVGLGRLDIYLSDDYVTHLSSLNTVLTDADYMGNSLTSELTYSRITTKIYECDSDAPVDTIYGRISVEIGCELNELSVENLAAMLVGKFDNTITDFEVGNTGERYYRLEMRYLYPNKTKALHYVVPKASIDESDRLRFINDNNTRPSITFGAHALPDNTDWEDYKAGIRIYTVDV